MNQKFYNEVKAILITARNRVYQTANFAMVEAYWNIGKTIIEEQGGNEKAEYGTGLLKELSKQMTQDFGKGFTVANLKNMRQFYLTFPNSYALRSELSWTHYRLLMRVENENAREFYMQEAYYERELMNEGDNPPIGIVLCADKSESVVKYTLPENETKIFASKYKLYLPSEEELLRELNQEYQALESGKTGEEDAVRMKEE